jgi:cytochrome P450
VTNPSLTEDEVALADAAVRDLFFTPEGRANPYPHYHRLREVAPVFRSTDLNAWLLTRYDDCKGALRDPRLEKHFVERLDARAPGWRARASLVWASEVLLNLDGPAHARLRRLVVREFTPRIVEGIRPRVEQMTDDLLDAMEQGGAGELMAEFAFKLPIAVIGTLLGVPPEDRPQFRELTQALTGVFELTATRAMLDAADAAVQECYAYFDRLIDARRADPQDDLLSRLVLADASEGLAEGEADRLTNAELQALSSLLFLAGFETTTNLIGNGVISLLAQPEQMDVLRAQPELSVNVADELLRHDGTIQLVGRHATTDIAFGDVTVPAGEGVLILIGAANRDPQRFADPDRIDFTRTKVQPLSFGGGVHFCLGAPLARMETEVVFRKLAQRFAAFELATDLPGHQDRLTLRAPTTVTLRLPNRPVGAAPVALSARPAGDDRAWRAEYRRQLDGGANTVDDAERAARVALLGRVPLFRSCSAEALARIADTAYPLSFDVGEHLCVEGDEAPDLYVIAAGEAEVVMGGRPIATAGADDVVGERGLLLGTTRAATVTATSHLVAYAISRERLGEVLDSSPGLTEAMIAFVRARYD